MPQLKFLLIIGRRPEAVKLAPFIFLLEPNLYTFN